MMLKYTLLLPLLFALESLTFAQKTTTKFGSIEAMIWIDDTRNRQIPIAVYAPNKNIKGRPIPVILSPGYPGKNTDYGYIARNLQSKGYLVVTVQHDLPGDEAMPTGENLFQRRLPHWQRGVANILFVLEKIKKIHPDLDYKKLVLIGHSNGGDISMLLANKYRGLVNKVISLDNRRVPFPRLTHPRILSIRSKDQPADSGVIPSGTEILKYRMKVVNAGILHNDMGGTAPKSELDSINLVIEDFLNESQFSELRNRIASIAAGAKGTMGIAIKDLQSGDTLTLNAAKRFPMQSVFKFPLAMYILHLVDQGKMKLDQPIHLTKEDLSIPYASPLRNKYPEGNVDVPLVELLSYTVSQSDNNGCDKLFQLCGGTGKLNKYLHQIGIKDIAVVATEKEMGKDSQVQYTNWCTPGAMLKLLERFNEGGLLSKESNALLWKFMTETVNAPKRIKGALPAEISVAHKPGTSGTDKTGFTATTNDVGIVTLPDGSRFAIVLYLRDSKGDQQAREGAMSSITRIVYDSYQ